MSRKSLTLVGALLCVLLWSAPATSGVLDEGGKLFLHGKYAKALAKLKSGLSNRQQAPKIQLMLARVYIHTGKYDEARKALKRATGKAIRAEVALLVARLAVIRGKYQQAIKLLTPLLTKNDAFHRARVLLGQTLYDVGRHTKGYALLDKLADYYNDSKITTAQDLTSLGQALHRNEFFRNANEVFGDAVKQDGNYLPANVYWGFLFLDKYNYNDASRSFEDVLKINPNHPDALAGMARVLLRSDHNRPGALARIKKALAVNPHHGLAITLKAEIYLDSERYSDALKTLTPLLKVNPNHLRALTLIGTAWYLLDDTAKFKRFTRRVLAINPKYAEYYHTVAEFGVKAHRYAEAIKLNLEALKINAKFWKSYVSLGINYSRTGDDAKAKTYLEKAFENDPFNVRAYNMSAILFDKVFKRYELVKSKNLIFRFHKKQSEILKRYVVPLLERAYTVLNKKYRFVAKKPLQIEIFKDPKHFAIRTVGLPRLSVHGVCFGHVITSRSPSDGNFNWGQVLWHEMAHVYHIQMSNSRVPRWFTEGLAVYEATLVRPEWRREMDLVLYEVFQQGRVVGIESFNLEFTQAKSFKQILSAYYQSYVVMEFIDKTWGFDKIRRMLLAYGKRQKTVQIFQQVLGVSVKEFDKRFVGFLKKRFAHLKGYFLVDLDFYRDLAAYQKEIKKNPKDARAHAKLAIAWLKRRNLAKAKLALETALKLDPKEPLANYIAANRAIAMRKLDEARVRLEKMITSGNDGYHIRIKLAALARKAKKVDDAVKHLLKAAKIVPNYPDAYRMLVSIYLKQKKKAEAYQVLKKLALIDQGRAGVVLQLARMDTAKKDWASVARWATMGLSIAPFRYHFHYYFGLAQLGRGKAKAALVELELARKLLEPRLVGRLASRLKDPATALYAALARANKKLGKSAEYKEFRDKAKQLNPDHPDVKGL